jgi:hypothetical protein
MKRLETIMSRQTENENRVTDAFVQKKRQAVGKV